MICAVALPLPVLNDEWREMMACPNCNDEQVFVRDGGVYLCLSPVHARTSFPPPKQNDGTTHDPITSPTPEA